MKDTPRAEPAGTTAVGPRAGPARTAGGVTLGQEQTREARRLAAAILEVLAGARTPAEAAAALGLSLPRYYQLESQALRGLLAACAPKPKGRQPSGVKELSVLRQDNERLRREVGRQQALVRAAQRAVGLAPPLPVKPAGKKPRRRRLARGLGVAARLRQERSDGVVSQESGDAVARQE
jgi:hypothetical protein